MNDHVIRLTSVTYAIRAQKLLDKHGFYSTVKKLPVGKNTQGCGYGIKVSGNLNTILNMLSSAGIRVLEVLGGDGA